MQISQWFQVSHFNFSTLTNRKLLGCHSYLATLLTMDLFAHKILLMWLHIQPLFFSLALFPHFLLPNSGPPHFTHSSSPTSPCLPVPQSLPGSTPLATTLSDVVYSTSLCDWPFPFKYPPHLFYQCVVPPLCSIVTSLCFRFLVKMYRIKVSWSTSCLTRKCHRRRAGKERWCFDLKKSCTFVHIFT